MFWELGLKLSRTNWIMQRSKSRPGLCAWQRSKGGGGPCLMSSCDHSIMHKKPYSLRAHFRKCMHLPNICIFPIQVVEVLSKKIPLAGMFIPCTWWKESIHMRRLAQLLQKKLDITSCLLRTSYLGPPISDLTDKDSLFVLHRRMFRDPYLPDLRSASGNLLLSEIHLNFSFPALSAIFLLYSSWRPCCNQS